MIDRVEAELARLRERLTAHPHPYEHGALYAAQQALEWVLRPNAAAAPHDAILRFPEGRRDCCQTTHQE